MPSKNNLFKPGSRVTATTLPCGLVVGKHFSVRLLLWQHWNSLDGLEQIITGHVGRKSGQKLGKLDEIKVKQSRFVQLQNTWEHDVNHIIRTQRRYQMTSGTDQSTKHLSFNSSTSKKYDEHKCSSNAVILSLSKFWKSQCVLISHDSTAIISTVITAKISLKTTWPAVCHQ